MQPSPAALLRRIRFWLAVFIAGLVLSGVTAFPLEHETAWLLRCLDTPFLQPLAHASHLSAWVSRVHSALQQTDALYPFLAYGTDWLAFAHLVIAIAFFGPYRDPVRNRWVITFGLIGCAAVLPLALIAGPVRGIPLPWRLVDCSFGVFGCIPLLRCVYLVRRLEQANQPLHPL